MTEGAIISLIALVLSAPVGVMLQVQKRRASLLDQPGGSFGRGRELEVEKETRKILFYVTLQQQQWAFWLLFACIVLGTVEGGILVTRLIFAPNLDLAAIGSAAGVVANLTFGAGAWKLYKSANERLRISGSE